jgi:hypothetical protein
MGRATASRTAVLGMMLAGVLGSGALTSPAAEARGVVSVGFYDALTPYGDWVHVGGLGTVWRPYAHVVGADFYPYFTGGQWAYTEYGWTWVSSWDWGWVPFHHGRWVFTDDFGWVWIPGDEWAPAWVEWRLGGGYIGWVPLGLPGYTYVGVWSAPRWCWFRSDDFGRRDWHRHRVYGDHERAAFHVAQPVRATPGQPPRGPDRSYLPTPPPPMQLGTPRALQPGSVIGEGRIAPAPHPVARAMRGPAREMPIPNAPSPGAGPFGPPPGAVREREPGRPPPDRGNPTPMPPPAHREEPRFERREEPRFERREEPRFERREEPRFQRREAPPRREDPRVVSPPPTQRQPPRLEPRQPPPNAPPPRFERHDERPAPQSAPPPRFERQPPPQQPPPPQQEDPRAKKRGAAPGPMAPMPPPQHGGPRGPGRAPTGGR